jgi:phosphoglycerate dehydrogenase-like enzyme
MVGYGRIGKALIREITTIAAGVFVVDPAAPTNYRPACATHSSPTPSPPAQVVVA